MSSPSSIRRPGSRLARTFLCRWLAAARASRLPPSPYEVACVCGQVLHGQRRPHHQVVRCPVCGHGVFILPSSPWLAATTPDEGVARPRSSPWRMPVIAAVCSLAVVLAVYLTVIPRLSREAGHPAAGPASSAAALRQRVQAGERMLTEGRFSLARQELSQVLAELDTQPSLFDAGERRELVQLQRQSDVLARLLDLTLEEIVQKANGIRDPAEWQARFADYRGKTVLFDDVVERRAGQPVLKNYVVGPRGQVRLALEDLALLKLLPLDEGPRLLFGARLADCRRELGGVWVFHFEPDSTVLLTSRAAAEACCPVPLEADVVDVLHRQEGYLRELGGQRPAMP